MACDDPDAEQFKEPLDGSSVLEGLPLEAETEKASQLVRRGPLCLERDDAILELGYGRGELLPLFRRLGGRLGDLGV